MELSVLNIAGQETGRKIPEVLVQVVLRTLSSEEEVVFLVPYREITASN